MMSRNLTQKQTDRITQLFDQIEAKSISREEAYQTLLRVFEYLPKDDDNIDIQKESKEKEFVKSTIHTLEESVKGKYSPILFRLL